MSFLDRIVGDIRGFVAPQQHQMMGLQVAPLQQQVGAGASNQAAPPQPRNVQAQPQEGYDQQAPQIGPTMYNLHHLAEQSNTARPAYDYTYGNNGPPMHMPAYSGQGWMPQSRAMPLQQPNFPIYNHLRKI